MNSILYTIKKMLGLSESYNAFDTDIIVHINTALMSLHQLGVGPSGFSIEDEVATWSDLVGTFSDVQGVKTYIYLKVRLLFDPPSTSFVLASLQSAMSELEWRITTQTELR